MLELVRHGLRQWRTGRERRPGGGAPGAGGGARRRERRSPGPGTVQGPRAATQPRLAARAAREEPERLEEGLPPPRARQRRSAPAAAPLGPARAGAAREGAGGAGARQVHGPFPAKCAREQCCSSAPMGPRNGQGFPLRCLGTVM
ncbi:uncharacterized protein GJ701_006606 [Geothlypis trichas]